MQMKLTSSLTLATRSIVLFLLLAVSMQALSDQSSKVDTQADNILWIDVRSKAEHVIDHIDGDMRIPHSEIVETLLEQSIDKTQPIALYCRSGGRAGHAKLALEKAGFTTVSNAGGIDDARQLRKLP